MSNTNDQRTSNGSEASNTDNSVTLCAQTDDGKHIYTIEPSDGKQYAGIDNTVSHTMTVYSFEGDSPSIKTTRY